MNYLCLPQFYKKLIKTVSSRYIPHAIKWIIHVSNNSSPANEIPFCKSEVSAWLVILDSKRPLSLTRNQSSRILCHFPIFETFLSIKRVGVSATYPWNRIHNPRRHMPSQTLTSHSAPTARARRPTNFNLPGTISNASRISKSLKSNVCFDPARYEEGTEREKTRDRVPRSSSAQKYASFVSRCHARCVMRLG